MRSEVTGRPAVSICVPIYNGARFVEAAVGSAFAQTFEDFEIVAVDDASTDDSVARLRGLEDPRLRVFENAENLGLVANANRSIDLARAPLIKFLFQDDALEPDCLARMVALFDSSEAVGLVFARRHVVLDQDAGTEATGWARRFRDLHSPLQPLHYVNHGGVLLDRWFAHGLWDNLVGEPSVVMARRACFERLGGFHPEMYQSWDAEMWLRILSVAGAGFVDEPLATFRVHAEAATRTNRQTGLAWLDRLWMVESLLAVDTLAHNRKALERLRRRATLLALRSAAAHLVRGVRSGSLAAPAAQLRAYVAVRRAEAAPPLRTVRPARDGRPAAPRGTSDWR
jgi:glycosyltransferase involved in cell wall biosynthesis